MSLNFIMTRYVIVGDVEFSRVFGQRVGQTVQWLVGTVDLNWIRDDFWITSIDFAAAFRQLLFTFLRYVLSSAKELIRLIHRNGPASLTFLTVSRGTMEKDESVHELSDTKHLSLFACLKLFWMSKMELKLQAQLHSLPAKTSKTSPGVADVEILSV